MSKILDLVSLKEQGEFENDTQKNLSEVEVKAIEQYLIANKEVRPEELKQIFPYLYSTLINADSVDSARVLCSDTLCIWMLRSIKVMRMQHADQLHEVLTKDTSTRIFEYIMDFLESGTGPLVNSLVSLLHRLIGFCKVLMPLHVELFQQWVDQGMKLPYTSRNLYFLIEILSKEIDTKYILTEHEKFTERCIGIMWSNPLANAASKAFVSIYQRLYKKGADEEWMSRWQELIMRGLNDEDLSRNIQVYLLPLLFKISPKSYHIFIERNLSFQINDLSNSEISMCLGLLKVGQDLALMAEIFDEQNTMVPFDYITRLLTHEESKFRINSFALLVGSAKGSQAIQKPVYDVLVNENILQLFFQDCDSIEFRNDFASLLRQFLIRLRDSLYSLSRYLDRIRKKNYDLLKQNELQQLISQGHDFLTWFLNFLKRNFIPGSSYGQLYLSMKLLQILVDLNLDNVPRTEAYDKLSVKTKTKISNNKMVFPFSIEIFDYPLLRLIVDNITNNYEDIRENSVNLLLGCSENVLSETILAAEQDINDKALNIITELKGKKSEGGAKVLQFLAQSYDHLNDTRSLKDLIDTIVHKLDFGLTYEFDNEKLHREQRVHGIFTALKLILKNINKERFSVETEYWKKLFLHVFGQISKVWVQVKPLLSNAAEDNESNEFDDKIVVNYSWKVIKESTALLSAILEIGDLDNKSLVDKTTFLLGADLIMDQLASVKHRGAFSSVYPSFVSACEICFKSDEEELASKPNIWLKQNIKLIKSKTQYISRRSGGLPYLITAILTAEKSCNKAKEHKDLIDYTFQELISIAKEEYIQNADEKMDIPQVHSFNCMKHIFIDSQLSSLCTPYVNQVLTLSLTNFYNPTWAIRNCAVMLFTALQNRLFGTSKLGELLPCISSRLFFAKYNGIEDILFQNLVDSSSTIDQDTKFNVIFPILTILSRLENTSTIDPKLQRFETLLIKCLHHKYWKVREMAAKSLAAIILPNNLIPTIRILLKNCHELRGDFNSIHGNLLSILEIIKRIESKLPDYKLKEVEANHILDYTLSFLTENEMFSWSTAKCFIEIVNCILKNNFEIELEDMFLNIIGNFIIRNLTTDIFDTTLNGARQLLLSSMIELLLSQYLKIGRTEDMIDLIRICLLSKNVYEVQLTAIRFCDSHINHIIEMDRKNYYIAILEELWGLVKDDSCWSFVRANALELIRIVTSRGEELDKADLRSKIEILLSFTLKEYSEDSNSKALEALGPLIGQISNCANFNDIANVQRFLDLANEFAVDERPAVVRLSSVHAIIAFVTTAVKKKEYGRYVAQGVFMLYLALYDDDVDIRYESAKYLSHFFGFDFTKVPMAITSVFGFNFLAKFGANISEPILIDHFINSKPQLRWKLSQADAQTEDSLFDVESLNLYRNDIQTHQTAAYMLIACNLKKPLDNGSIYQLTKKVNEDLDYIIEFVTRKGHDGYIGWCKDEFIFTSILEAVSNMKSVIILTDDTDLKERLELVLNLFDKFQVHFMIKHTSDFFICT
ncbi:uncharacterized protein AC631_03396 [Debaryomyces fabryi]|uniref:Uncharacterized protein n=1 Tax=Debaryomyces fabryi TaxID=58627 RepID=A0A0V1PX47_9ASCO|nr:uncharacterized protein AC631_03396 [Debaryomyces fabryi]KSA00861.1 hypothetical protein AC631_03396 [Debaryomyces fabryi]CUM45525.1 unnamed protein product [Debaryomyces fabryi]